MGGDPRKGNCPKFRLTLRNPDRLARDDVPQERGPQSHRVRQEGQQGRVINLGEGGVGWGKDGGRGNGINSLLLFHLYLNPNNSSMPHLCDIGRRHGRDQGGEPLVRHEGGQQRLGAGGGDGDWGQEACWAPSDIHRGGQRGRGSVNRNKGIGLDIGGGVFGDSWSVFCDSRGVLWSI